MNGNTPIKVAETRKARDDGFPRINIRFFGPIIGIIGKSRDTIDLQTMTTTIREIILHLSERYGEKFEAIALNKGDLNPGLIVFLNGSHVTDWNRKLSLNDEIELMIASQMKGGL